MKAQSIIIAAIFSLQVSFLFASGTDTRLRINNNEFVNVSVNILAPVAPAEATFEDETIPALENLDLPGLTPVTLAEATFDDETGDMLVFSKLTPVTPFEADFNDDYPAQLVDITALAPGTPGFTDFEELR